MSFQLKKGLIDTPNSALYFKQVPFGAASTAPPREDYGTKFCYGNRAIRAEARLLSLPQRRSEEDRIYKYGP